MKNLKLFILVMVATMAITATSCHDRNIDKKQIDTEAISDGVKQAIRETIYDPGNPVVKQTNDADSITIVEAGSTDTVSAPPFPNDSARIINPTINVYVGDPNDPAEAEPYKSFDDDDDEAFIVAIVLILVFGIPSGLILLIVIAVLVFIYKRNRNRNRVIQQAIEAGYTLPDAFYNGGQAQPKTRDSKLLQSAIRQIGLGLILFVAFTFGFDMLFVGIICLIPAATGIGQLIAYYAGSREDKQEKHNDGCDA